MVRKKWFTGIWMKSHTFKHTVQYALVQVAWANKTQPGSGAATSSWLWEQKEILKFLFLSEFCFFFFSSFFQMFGSTDPGPMVNSSIYIWGCSLRGGKWGISWGVMGWACRDYPFCFCFGVAFLFPNFMEEIPCQCELGWEGCGTVLQ